MLAEKRIDLPLLASQLAAASVPHRVLMMEATETPGMVDLHDQDDQGEYLDLPPEARAVIDAHVAPPVTIEYAGTQNIDAVVRTTDDVPLEVFRFSTNTKHIYNADFRMTAVDAVSGASKHTSAEMVFKRTPSALVQVGNTYVPATFQDSAASSWQIQPMVQVTDLVIFVKGASGRTIDWLLVGTIGAYAPEGLGEM